MKWTLVHWLKLAVGGLLTGLYGLLFLHIHPGNLVPIGPNYEAVGEILASITALPSSSFSACSSSPQTCLH